MNSLAKKILYFFSFCIVIASAGNALAADSTSSSLLITKQKDASVPQVTFLSREVAKSLDITPIPASEPVPLIVGTYWSCHINAYDLEICRIKLVVCNDDQTFCVDVNAKQEDLSKITFFRQGERSLPKITQIPSSDPVPLIIGTYWNCRVNDQDFNICRLKIVVCEDDGSFCTTVN